MMTPEERIGGIGHALALDGRHGRVGAAAYAEASRAELSGLLELDVQRAGHRVALVDDVLSHESRELFGEGAAEGREAFEVGRRQLDREVVGHQHAFARQDVCGVVDLALECSRNLDWLDRAAKSARESTGDGSFEPLLKSLQHPRHQPPPFVVFCGVPCDRIGLGPDGHMSSVVGREETHPISAC